MLTDASNFTELHRVHSVVTRKTFINEIQNL